MFKRIFKDKFMLFSIIAGVIVVGFLSFVLITATATTKAVVFKEDVSAGTTITDSMLSEIDVPKATPSGFIKTKSALVGERLSSNVRKKQLIYESDLMSSIDISASQNEEFVTTSVVVPNKNAVGGLLTAGDFVDVSVLVKEPEKVSENLMKEIIDKDQLKNRDEKQSRFYFVLSNIRILDSTTAVSAKDGSNLNAADGEKEGGGSSSGDSACYLLTLSYNDLVKLREAESVGEIHFTLTPKQNQDKAPMLDKMREKVSDTLSDGSPSPIPEEKEKSKNDQNSNKSQDGDKNSNENKSEQER